MGVIVPHKAVEASPAAGSAPSAVGVRSRPASRACARETPTIPRVEFRATCGGAELLRQAGFTVQRFEDLTSRVKQTWTICITRTLGRFFTDRRYREFLFSTRNRNRSFALTMFRIWLAYETGAMRYGLFAVEKSAVSL